MHNAGVTQQFNSTRTLWPAIVHNVKIYGRDLEEQVGAVVASWLVLSIAAFLLIPALRRHNENHLYLACILALVPLLLPAANRDVRYLFFAIPAFIVLGFESLELVFKRLLPAQSVPALTVLVAVYLSLSQVYEDSRRPVRGTDHRQLAQALKARSPRRLVYLGENNWYLVVAMRYVNPDSRAIVIRGDKMDPGVFTPEGFERFARRYGVDTVVLEPASNPHPWDFLLVHPTASMVCDRVMSTETNQQKKIAIFDFKNPTSQPESTLEVPISYTSDTMSLDL